jgi:uncharacterized iron-regulated membrane protein
MSFRRFVLITHRWLGLLSAPILIIVGSTGVILMVDFESLPSLQRIGRYASALHERLAMGVIGHRVVLAVTALAIVLEIGGLVLWWKRKTLAVALDRGLWRACFDLHHLAGLVCVPAMLLGAVTAVAMFVVGGGNELYGPFRRLHVGRFPLPLRIIYGFATLGFVVQGLTGVVIWWKRRD